MSTNITYHHGSIGPRERARLLKQRGCVVWLTGLSGSGKSTIAHALEARLIESGHAAFVLDGDNLRQGLNADLGFAPEDRKENVRRTAAVACLFADAGVIAVTALISPYRSERSSAKSHVGPDRFLEIFIDVPLDECERRDPKGLYARARRGEVENFTGISSPYEEPLDPDLRIGTGSLTIEESVGKIAGLLEERRYLNCD